MLTPLFSLSQTDHEFIMNLRVPLADLSRSEFLIENPTLYFAAPPYYLRLDLPGSVEESGDYIKFEMDSGNMKITMQKTNPGEHFEDLDLISKFMVTPSANKTSRVGIQVLDSSDVTPEGEVNYDWFANTSDESLPESLSEDSEIDVKVTKYPYGFAASKSDLFEKNEEAQFVLDLKNADFVPPLKRHHLQHEECKNKFCKDHYMADFFEKEVVEPALKQEIPWIVDNQRRPDFTDDHSHRLTVLASHPLPLLPPISTSESHPENSRASIYLGLVDLLLAYTYDYRVSMGEHNCESGWTIAKLSGTLSWLEVYTNLRTVVVTFYERALSYPLMRNFKLCTRIKQDVKALLLHENAKGWILYILLEIRRMLIEYPGYYFYAELYLDDYIVWLQKSASAYVLNHLGKALASVKVKKEDLSLPLKEAEDEGMEILAQQMGEVSLDK